MRYYLSDNFVLKWLETPSVYDIKGDELYELDEEAFRFLRECSAAGGCEGAAADIWFMDYCLSEGILSARSADVKRPPLIKSPVPSLRYLELQITDRCNLKCRHCYINKPEVNELELERVKRVLGEFEEMQGLRLLITGGEPLTYGKFSELNSMLPDYKFRKILFTNGLLLDKSRLKGLNAEEIQFSVDGMERGHEVLRGKGTYKTVIRNIKDAVAAGVSVSVATMVHSGNLGEFDEMENLFKETGVKDWTVDVPCIAGSLKDNGMFLPPPEKAGKYLNYGFGGGLHGGGGGFACGLHLVSVLANGDVCKCTFYPDAPAGRIEEGLRNCWSIMKPLSLSELECADLRCEFLEACRGGCRFRAESAPERYWFPEARCGKEKAGIKKARRDIYKCFGYGIIKACEHEAHDEPL